MQKRLSCDDRELTGSFLNIQYEGLEIWERMKLLFQDEWSDGQ